MIAPEVKDAKSQRDFPTAYHYYYRPMGGCMNACIARNGSHEYSAEMQQMREAKKFNDSSRPLKRALKPSVK